jgi:hypothetical protein
LVLTIWLWLLILVENIGFLGELDMSKKADYPRASIKKSLEIAATVSALGGTCNIEVCAHGLNKKVGGGFRDLVNSAAKYGFIVQKQGKLNVTDLYKEIKLAYSPEDEKEALRKAFLNIPLFQQIFERFKGEKIPFNILDKLLVKEFAVPENFASRIGKYFIEGAKHVGVLDPDNYLITPMQTEANKEEEDTERDVQHEVNNLRTQDSSSNFQINISGPGINSTISILEEDDFLIVEAMIKKINNRLKSKKQESEVDM